MDFPGDDARAMDKSRLHLPHLCRRLGTALCALILPHCAPSYLPPAEHPAEAVRTETFEYRKWVHKDVKPEVVVVGIHGFCGAAVDYKNLGTHLMRHQPNCAVYAYDVRGQGKDPLEKRRGDIDDPENWSRDLLTFTDLVRKEHPDARIVWFGESMGAMIASHTYARTIAAGTKPPCDAIGLSSPIVKFPDDYPTWKKELVRTASRVAPAARVSVDALTGGEDVQMTADSVHSQQAETNPWHVDRHTLRLLVALGDLIDEMPDCARTFQVPTIVLNGGKDYFSLPHDVEAFTGCVPIGAGRTHKYYPDAHHLLMYDDEREEVFSDIARWLRRLPSAR